MTQSATPRPSAPAGPGPSGPAGPHPTPTHPRPSSPPTPAPPSGGTDCDCGHGDLEMMFHLAPCPRARPVRTPTLGMVIRDAERLGEQMIATLGRQFDPGSVSETEAWPGMLLADIHLSAAVANVRQALRNLGDLAALRHPPVGSAVPVMFPSHPQPHAGEVLTPSLATAGPTVSESPEHLVEPGAGDNLRHEPDRPGAPGLPPRPLNPRPPAGDCPEPVKCNCFTCRGFRSQW